MKKEWFLKLVFTPGVPLSLPRNSSTSKECFSIILSNLIDLLCRSGQVVKAIPCAAYSKHLSYAANDRSLNNQCTKYSL